MTIGFKGKRYQLGTYKEFNEAVEVRMEAEHLIHDGFLNAYDKWSELAEKDPKWAEENPLVYDVLNEDGELRVITNIV